MRPAAWRLVLLGLLAAPGTGAPAAVAPAAGDAAPPSSERPGRAEVLTLGEAAALLRASEAEVERMAREGALPGRRIAGAWRFSAAALLDWLGQRAPASPGPSEPAGRAAAPRPAERGRGSPGTPAVGEKPAAQTADQVALRDQGVFLRGGRLGLELIGSWSRAERDFGLARIEHSVAAAELAVRYGLVNDLQVSARMPWRYRRDVGSGPDPLDPGRIGFRDTHQGFGDLSLGIVGVALREAVGRPAVVLSLEGVVPTGPGDAGAGGGIALVKSYDPVILFGGASGMYGLSTDVNDADRALAQYNFGFNLGYAFAVNESVALNGQVMGVFRNYRATASGSRPPREQYRLQVGVTYLVTRRLFLEPTVTVGLGGASPDLVLGLSIPTWF